MCLYHVLAPGPCETGLCWVWSRHGPPPCGQAQSCSPFIILTSRRDPINYYTSLANVTSLSRTPPGREPEQPAVGEWMSRSAACTPQTHSRASRPLGRDRRASVCGRVTAAELQGFLQEAVRGQGPHQLHLGGCKIPAPCPEVSFISFLFKKKSKKAKPKWFVCISIQYQD